MPRPPVAQVEAGPSRRARDLERVRARLLDVDADRRKSIDDAIDYFGAGRAGARDPRGGSSLDSGSRWSAPPRPRGAEGPMAAPAEVP
jgi:hypothetical protein